MDIVKVLGYCKGFWRQREALSADPEDLLRELLQRNAVFTEHIFAQSDAIAEVYHLKTFNR